MPGREPIRRFIQSVGQLSEHDQDMILRMLRLLQNAPIPAQERARSMLHSHVLVDGDGGHGIRAALEDILAYLSLHQSPSEIASYAAIGAGRDSLI